MGRFGQAGVAYCVTAFWIASTVAAAAPEAGTYTVSDMPELSLAVEPEPPSAWKEAVEFEPAGSCSTAFIEDGCLAANSPELPGLIDQPGLLQLLWHPKEGPWTARFDTMLLWRNAPRDRPLFSTIVPGTTSLGATALNANQLQSDMIAAPRVSLFHGNGCGDALEATYIYAGNFYSERSLPQLVDGYATAPPGILGNAWDPVTGTPLTAGSATLLGNLQSLEFNTRTRLGRGASQFILGVRWLQWQETVLIKDNFIGPNLGDTGYDLYRTGCTNSLFGGQIGIDSVLLTTNRGVRFEGLAKAGAYYNNAVQSSSFSYATDAPFSFSAQNRVTRSPAAGAFVGEAGLTAVIPISCNWDLRCGYFGMWLESIAQPVNQLSGQQLTQINPPPGTLTTNGGLVLQGLSLGIEGRW